MSKNCSQYYHSWTPLELKSETNKETTSTRKYNDQHNKMELAMKKHDLEQKSKSIKHKQIIYLAKGTILVLE